MWITQLKARATRLRNAACSAEGPAPPQSQAPPSPTSPELLSDEEVEASEGDSASPDSVIPPAANAYATAANAYAAAAAPPAHQAASGVVPSQPQRAGGPASLGLAPVVASGQPAAAIEVLHRAGRDPPAPGPRAHLGHRPRRRLPQQV